MYKIPEIVKAVEIHFDTLEFNNPVRKKYTINIMSFFDDDFNADRYSYEVKYPNYNNSVSTMASGGYGIDNEIIYPNMYQALMVAIDQICGFDREQFKRITRDIKLNYLIDEQM